MRIVALPSGEKLEIKEKQEAVKETELPGQMSLVEYLEAIHDTD
jgi:hypothetical protein